MRNDIRAGSGPVGMQIQAAEAYYNGVMRQQALGNSLFDKFASYMKERRTEKREDKADAQRDEIHNLQKDTTLKQNTLLDKNIKSYDETLKADLYAKRASANNANANASHTYTQRKLLNEELDDRKNFKKMMKNLDPALLLPQMQSSSNTITNDDIAFTLSQSANPLLPSRE